MTAAGSLRAVAAAGGALGLAGFAATAALVHAGGTSGFDGAVQAWVLAHQYRFAHGLFVAITVLGGISAMRLLAIAVAAFAWYHGRRLAAAGLALLPFVSIWTFEVLKHVVARPRPLGLGGPVDGDYSFPSGHATMSAAVCGTLAYVLWREGYLRGGIAGGIALIVPALVGASRLYLNVHWASDVVGGWCVGLLLAALFVTLLDRFP